MHTKIFSATPYGTNAHLVEVEVDISYGLVNFFVVGLPDTSIKESTKRITAALKNCGIQLPAKRITVNLAPADLKKEGSLFDLPIALGILQAAGFLSVPASFWQETLVLGELSLDGTIRFIKGALAIAYDSQYLNKKRIILPAANAAEASLIESVEVIGVSHLTELVHYLRNEITIAPTKKSYIAKEQSFELDFADVKGQFQAKRALQIAAAGRHNILFIGPPGSGKTMLAKRLPSIMPAMSYEEILQTSKLYSVSGKLQKESLVAQRPFRNPHHTISQAGLIGGGSYPQPGEISLAHHGILFLDELTEFKRSVLEALRQPLESQEVVIARAQQTITFPASFMLIAALNPCPCGYYGDKKRTCACSADQIQKYIGKLSGPLLDRIDLQVQVQSLEYDQLKSDSTTQTNSQQLYHTVIQALAVQEKRFGNNQIFNSKMNSAHLQTSCALSHSAEQLVKKIFDQLRLSMRGYHKLLKVARTIADLEQSEIIEIQHIQEAMFYRCLDQFLEQRMH